MSKSLKHILEEAIQRWLDFGSCQSLEKAWTGLGFYTDYKIAITAGYMQFVKPTRKGTMGWLRLTPLGVEAVRQMLRDKLRPQG